MDEQGRPDKPLPVRELESGETSSPSGREEEVTPALQGTGEEVTAAPQGTGEEEEAVVQDKEEEVSAAPRDAGVEADAVDQDNGVEGKAVGQDTEDEVRRPTPVRMAMEGGEAETPDESTDQRTIPDPEGGEEWVVTVGGRSVSGVLPLRTVSLLELYFARLGEPDVPVRRTLLPGENLGDFSDDQLVQAFHVSEAYSPSLREVKEGNGRTRRRRGHPNSWD